MSKILLVCNADFTFNKFLIPLANKLLKKGFSVGVICDGKKINYDNLDGRVEFHNISIPRKVSVRKFIFATRSIRKVIIDNKYFIYLLNYQEKFYKSYSKSSSF